MNIYMPNINMSIVKAALDILPRLEEQHKKIVERALPLLCFNGSARAMVASLISYYDLDARQLVPTEQISIACDDVERHVIFTPTLEVEDYQHMYNINQGKYDFSVLLDSFPVGGVEYNFYAYLIAISGAYLFAHQLLSHEVHRIQVLNHKTVTITHSTAMILQAWLGNEFPAFMFVNTGRVVIDMNGNTRIVDHDFMVEQVKQMYCHDYSNHVKYNRANILKLAYLAEIAPINTLGIIENIWYTRLCQGVNLVTPGEFLWIHRLVSSFASCMPYIDSGNFIYTRTGSRVDVIFFMDEVENYNKIRDKTIQAPSLSKKRTLVYIWRVKDLLYEKRIVNHDVIKKLRVIRNDHMLY
jgi:hypothetical protein